MENEQQKTEKCARNEKNKLVQTNDSFTLDEVYSLISQYKFRFSEMGGFVDVASEKFHTFPEYAEYDVKVDKPFYNFDFRVSPFQDKQVLWHLHPFQNADVHNSYPSFQDICVAWKHPDKMFVLVTKMGIFFYRSTIKKPCYNFNKDYYNNVLLPHFKNYDELDMLNKCYFQKLMENVLLFVYVSRGAPRPFSAVSEDK